MKQIELEAIYDEVAEAIDNVEPAQRELYLAKLVLLLAKDHPDPDAVQAHLRAAAEHLDR